MESVLLHLVCILSWMLSYHQNDGHFPNYNVHFPRPGLMVWTVKERNKMLSSILNYIPKAFSYRPRSQRMIINHSPNLMGIRNDILVEVGGSAAFYLVAMVEMWLMVVHSIEAKLPWRSFFPRPKPVNSENMVSKHDIFLLKTVLSFHLIVMQPDLLPIM